MKVAIVTGASRGIGRACAEKLALDGFTVIVNYSKSEEQAQEVLDTIMLNGGNGMLCRADVSNPDDVKAMMRGVAREYRQIDVLVNNAGIVDDEYLLMQSPKSLERCINVNVKGCFYCTQAAALKMFRRKSGHIINISSVSAKTAIAGQTVYSATKGAVCSMTQTAAKELAPYGIRVNAVAPGFIETEMTDALPEEKRDEYRNAVPLGRFGTPDEVAALVSMLCGDACSYMTGQTLILDGGLSL